MRIVLVALLLAACEKQPSSGPGAGPATADAAPAAAKPPPEPPPPPPPAPKDDGREMVRIEGGRFAMGQDDDPKDDSAPAHDVSVKTFDLDKHEVTTAAYVKFLAAHGGHQCPGASDGLCVHLGDKVDSDVPFPIQRASDGKGYQPRAGLEEHPVYHVSLTGARRYCAWAKKRLPTEAEWEYAARHDAKTGKPRTFPWGDTFAPKRANCAEDACKDGFAFTAPVGSFPAGATPAGVHDLGGNVTEWTSDCYTWSYAPGATCAEGFFVARGGDHSSSERWTAGHRRHQVKDSAFGGIGFRCARDVP